MTINWANDNTMSSGETPLQEVNSYKYLVNKVDNNGGSDRNIRIRILRNVWKSKEIKTYT